MTQLEKNICNQIVTTQNEIFFSIIIPIFNSAKYLADLLDNLVAQDFTNFEVILINDGSTDNSINIINSYKNKFSALHIINQSNLGQGVARNIGLKAAKGKYILFIDSDDTLNSSKSLLDLYNHILKNPTSDIIIFNYKKIYGKNLTKTYNKQTKNLNIATVTSLENKKKLISIKRIGVPWNKVYKTKFIRDNNIHFAVTLKFEDAYFFWQSILLASKITFFNYTFYNYRKHNTSLMRTRDNKNLEIIKVYQLIIEYLEQHKLFNQFYECLLNKALPSFISQFKKLPFKTKKVFFRNLKEFQLKYCMYKDCKTKLNKKTHKLLKALNTNSFVLFYLKSFLL